MATYSLTFEDVLEDYPVFAPQNIIDYDELKADICDHFYLREINYETPKAFIRKFNHKLKILAPNYNKMIASEMIQFEPLVTEYITADRVLEGATSVNGFTGEARSGGRSTSADVSGHSRTEENKAENSANAGELSGIEAKLIKNLLSETNREERSKQFEESGNDYSISRTDGTSKTGRDLATTKTSDEETNYTEHTDITETVNGSVEKTGSTTDVVNKTDNQTGGDWTEEGNDRRHGLTVNSDTPNAMLFNQPPNTAVYGTGRSHYEGRVASTGVRDFTEAANIDRGSYDLGSEDSPWFNYASGANNDIGHSSYDKKGTTTYSRSGNSDGKGTSEEHETSVKTTETDKDVDGNKTVHYTEHGTEKEFTDNATTSDSSNSSINSKAGVEAENTGAAKNAVEDNKEDSLKRQTYSDTSTNQNVGVTVGADNRKTEGVERYNDDTKTETKNQTRNDESEKTVRRGRTLRSPSQLLKEYRETLTYNAKLWLFGELESCFLQIY